VLESLINCDTFLFILFNHTIANPVFDFIFPIITYSMHWIAPGIIAAALFIWFQKKKALIILCLSLLTVGVSDPVCNRLIKPAVHRLRPCNPQVQIDKGRFLIGRKTSLSFPSSHAMNIFAQAALLALFYRKRAVWFFLFASIIGFSRIYVGVHYPLDVLAGAIFGVCIGAGVYFLFQVLYRQLKLRAKARDIEKMII
jgi:undecaprenyl-diphosphatase